MPQGLGDLNDDILLSSPRTAARRGVMASLARRDAAFGTGPGQGGFSVGQTEVCRQDVQLARRCRVPEQCVAEVRPSTIRSFGVQFPVVCAGVPLCRVRCCACARIPPALCQGVATASGLGSTLIGNLGTFITTTPPPCSDVGCIAIYRSSWWPLWRRAAGRHTRTLSSDEAPATSAGS